MDSLGKKLKKLREEKKLTQREAALKMDIAPGTLACYETERRKPSMQDYKKISEFYGVALSYFGFNPISNYIGFGAENAVTRAELCRRTGWNDRRVRQAIEDARHDGEIIINRQDGKGYYKPVLITDIEKQYEQNERRAKSILNYQKHLRKALKDAGRL
ncbi:MAG: helix-turn-helix domain-containing protein [Candidatus Avelusimicrobium sp.]